MPSDNQSIEDLIGQANNDSTDESVQIKLNAEEKKIKLRNIERITQNKAQSLGLSYIDLFGFPISPEALSLINEEDARKLSAVCFFYNGQKLRIGTVNPENEELRVLFKNLLIRHYCEGKIYLLSENSFNYALRFYKSIPKVKTIKGDFEINEEDLLKFNQNILNFKDLQGYMAGVDITHIVTVILSAAIKSSASDIHIEEEEGDIKVRFRIDGILYDVAVLDKEMSKKIISRLKILAKVKINIADKPQEGRISIFLTKDKIDIRASFLPTAHGESIVMRLLRASSLELTFENLGFMGRSYEQIKRQIGRPSGMIIAAGPTGSGKTTTLYAILKTLNNSETKIVTIEDPIEYQLKGINQSQANEKYNFAQGLRSIIRQDPDILLVGEIRDLETAETSIQAALTGHLLLSSIHTNDASGAIPRFLSMGAKPFLLAPSLNAIIGQRLVRRNCPKCKIKEAIGAEILSRVKELLEKLPKEEKDEININNLEFYKGQGCDYCHGIGYKGRIGIYEVLVMNNEIKKLILAASISEYEIHNCAIKNGMVTMVQDGLLKAMKGITSVEEVFRVAE